MTERPGLLACGMAAQPLQHLLQAPSLNHPHDVHACSHGSLLGHPKEMPSHCKCQAWPPCEEGSYSSPRYASGISGTHTNTVSARKALCWLPHLVTLVVCLSNPMVCLSTCTMSQPQANAAKHDW
jgi:hypothetical protein